ncbi:MAG TPA: hypothetical protein VK176_03130 [Phycisphaerales bacterium]|nr:hypothetical protein [Phycisphaerales bacterium]
MPGLEDEEFFSDQRIHLAFDLVDAAKYVFKGSGVVDGGADEPDLGERQPDQEDDLAGGRNGGDTAEERGQSRRRDGDAPVQRGHSEGDEGIEGVVLLHQDVDLALNKVGVGG